MEFSRSLGKTNEIVLSEINGGRVLKREQVILFWDSNLVIHYEANFEKESLELFLCSFWGQLLSGFAASMDQW